MAQSLTHKILRATLWLIFGIVTLVLIIPVLLYIPPIQDFAKDIALKEVRKSTGMDVSIGYLRLKFPLNVQLHDVTVIEATGDTMATLGTAGINVQFMPLLKGDIAITGTQLKDVRYNLGTPDSAIYLTAYVHTFNADGANMNFSKGNINVDRAALDGAEINLVLKDTITTEKTDTSATKPLLIHAGDITLSNVTYTMSMLPTIDSLSTHIPTARLIDGTVDMSTNSIHAQMLKVDSISATYLTPSAEFLAEYPTADSIKSTSTSESAPWTITADSLRLTANNAIYAMRGASPYRDLT